MHFTLFKPENLVRSAMLLLFLPFLYGSAFTQGFTDGFEWVPGTPASSVTSPVFSNANCQGISYTLSVSTGEFNYDPTAVNGSGILVPAFTATNADDIIITITFNTPVSNLGLRVLDLDEDNMFDGGPPEEYFYNVSPAPSSVVPISGINPIFLSGNTVTPDDGNPSNANNNPGGWIYWTGEVTTLSIAYHRAALGYECVLDSMHFECPCPAPGDYIQDVMVCPGQQATLNATTPNASYLWNTGSTSAVIYPSTPGMYSVAVNINGCIYHDTAIVSNVQVPTIDLGNDTAICAGESVLLSVPAALAPAVWQDGSSGLSFSADQSGTYHATANSGGCVISDTIVIAVVPYPFVDLGPDRQICNGSSVTLDAGNGAASYLWSTGAVTQQITTGSPGTYWVRVSNGNCSSEDTVLVQLKPSPENPLPPDTVICPGDTLHVTLNNTGNVNYSWFNGSTESTASFWQNGAYWVSTTLDGCTRTDTLFLQLYPAIGTPGFDPDLVICEGRNTLIGPVLSSAYYQVIWDNGFTATPMAVDAAGVYGFTIYTPCESESFSVTVTEERCFCTVYLPNAFTPDNNGMNEVFQPAYDCPLDNFELLIFNRWGEIVYSSTDPDAAWDGTYRGKLVQDGVYVYRMVYISAQTHTYEEITGHVSVLR